MFPFWKVTEISENLQGRDPFAPATRLEIEKTPAQSKKRAKLNNPDLLFGQTFRVGSKSRSKRKAIENPRLSIHGHTVELAPKEDFPEHIDSRWVFARFTRFVDHPMKLELRESSIELHERYGEGYWIEDRGDDVYLCKYTGADTKRIKSLPEITHLCVYPAGAKIKAGIDVYSTPRRSTRSTLSEEKKIIYVITLHTTADRTIPEVSDMLKAILSHTTHEIRVLRTEIRLVLDSPRILIEVSKIDDIKSISIMRMPVLFTAWR